MKDFQQLPQTSLPTLLVSAIVLALIVGCKRFAPNIPGALIAVIGMIAASFFFNFSAKGISTLGTVPSGLPNFGFPQGVTWGNVATLLPIAFSVFLVILAQSAATSRAYAAKYNERFSENSDLVGLTLASVGAGLSGTFVVNGSPTKTQMVDGAGGRSQISQLTTSVIVLIVLLFLTKPLAYMPNAVLAAVVFYIGVELIDIKGMRSIFAQRRSEFWVALITAATVVFIGVEQAIFLAMALSLLDHVRRGYQPKNSVLAPDVVDDEQGWRSIPVSAPVEAAPGLMIYRFNHSLYYANTERFSEEILDLVNGADPPVSWLCLDAAAIDDIDWSGGATIRQSFGQLKERNVRLVFAEVEVAVRAELDDYGVTELVGKDAFYSSVAAVMVAYKQQAATDKDT